jgi:hypothetical protein
VIRIQPKKPTISTHRSLNFAAPLRRGMHTSTLLQGRGLGQTCQITFPCMRSPSCLFHPNVILEFSTDCLSFYCEVWQLPRTVVLPTQPMQGMHTCGNATAHKFACIQHAFRGDLCQKCVMFLVTVTDHIISDLQTTVLLGFVV